MLGLFEMSHFPLLILKMGKMGHFKNFEDKNVDYLKKTRDQFSNQKGNFRFRVISK